MNVQPVQKRILKCAIASHHEQQIVCKLKDMNRYIIQQEASGWFWRRESDRGWWFGWFWSDLFWPRARAGPFPTAEEAKQDASNDQLRRFSRRQGI
jgi:hypothetical protein